MVCPLQDATKCTGGTILALDLERRLQSRLLGAKVDFPMREITITLNPAGIRAFRQWILTLMVAAAVSGVLVAARVQASNREMSSIENKRTEEFSRLAAQLAAKRQQGDEETEKLQEQALGILDSVVLDGLNATNRPNLAALNEQLAKFVSQTPPVGEDYRVTALDTGSSAYALVANLGVGGPSAVRLYSKPAAAVRYQLSARIDRFTQKDFFDEYLELIPAAPTAGVFVTVSGRTDELQTGSFNAWQFDGQKVRLLWASELLSRSNYENRPDGFFLSFCAEPDEDKPRECHQISEDRYQWDGAVWKRIEHKVIPAVIH